MTKPWSKIKKELEQVWIAPSVKGRVQYFMTRFREAHDQRGRIAIVLDGVETHAASDLETEIQTTNLWDRSGEPALEATTKGLLHTSLFAQSYAHYSNQALEDNIHARDALVRLFTIFDRRVGKKFLVALEHELIGEAVWLAPFYAFRVACESEFKRP